MKKRIMNNLFVKNMKRNAKVVANLPKIAELQKKMGAVEQTQDPAEIKQLMDEIEEKQKELGLT
jgi:hypothetical protein